MGNSKVESVFIGLLVSLILITSVILFLVDPSKYLDLGDLYTGGEFMENVAGASLVAFLAWKFAFKKKKTTGMFTFATVMLALNVTRILWPDHRVPEQQGWVIFDQQILALQRGDRISRMTYSTKDYGVVAKYLNVENQQLLDVQSLNNQLSSDIRLHSLADIYEDGIDLPQVLQENKKKVQYLEDRVTRYKIEGEELWYKKLDEKVGASNMTDQEKQGFYFAMNPIRHVNIQEVEQVTKLEIDYFKIAEQLYDFLIRDQEHFKIQNHQITFQYSTDRNLFASYQKQLDDLLKQINFASNNQVSN